MHLLQVLHVSHTQYQVHRYLLLPIDVVNSAPGFGRESAREIYFDQNNQPPSDAHLPTIPPFHSKIARFFTQERNSYILTKVDIYVIEKPPTFAIKACSTLTQLFCKQSKRDGDPVKLIIEILCHSNCAQFQLAGIYFSGL